MASTTEIAVPSLSVQLAIHPQILVLSGPQPNTVVVDGAKRYTPLNWEEQPQISLTVTSHAEQAITIFTWTTIFNLSLSQRRRNFFCSNLTNGSALKLETTRGPQRLLFSRTKGESDEQYFVTLEPGVPKTFSSHLGVAWSAGGGLQRGHRYSFGVSEGEGVYWWRYGTKDEVMAPAGEPSSVHSYGCGKIPLEAEPVQFEVQ